MLTGAALSQLSSWFASATTSIPSFMFRCRSMPAPRLSIKPLLCFGRFGHIQTVSGIEGLCQLKKCWSGMARF
jgi:hypothetical protein